MLESVSVAGGERWGGAACEGDCIMVRNQRWMFFLVGGLSGLGVSGIDVMVGALEWKCVVEQMNTVVLDEEA